MPAITIVPPAAEPLSLAETKSFLRVEHEDDDAVVASLIAAARIHVEAQTHRALITQTWRLVRDAWPATGRLALMPAPLRSLVAVRVYDAAGEAVTLDTDSFDVDAASAPPVLAVKPGVSQPGRNMAGIEIEFEAGYGDDAADVPEPLRHAIRLLVAHWYENRGIVAIGGERAVMPASVRDLLATYRVLSL